MNHLEHVKSPQKSPKHCVSVCPHGTYNNGSGVCAGMLFICFIYKLACDVLCNGCTGGRNTLCSSCDPSAKSIDGVPNKCVAQCSDHANNFY